VTLTTGRDLSMEQREESRGSRCAGKENAGTNVGALSAMSSILPWLPVAQAGGARRDEPCHPTISLLVLMTLAVLLLAVAAHFGEELLDGGS
jgi:hypothetical protein